jgi:ABC-2 type transport system ATP-binding protein
MELCMEGIFKNYKDKEVLKGINATLGTGVYGLLGPNGAGKTTLIRILADVLNPTKGRVLIDGRDKNTCGDEYRSRIGFLPQDVSFYPSFTGRDYLGYAAALKGLDKKHAEKRIEELADSVGLSNDLHRKCAVYSNGMRRRLGIAQALLNEPEILILDEPTSGLDPHERIKFRNIISVFSKDRLVLLSTHIVSDIESIAKEIMMLEYGKIEKKQTAEEYAKQISGCVWTVLVPIEDLMEFQKNATISNVVPRGDMMEARVISEKKPSADAQNTPPNLEDAYLYLFDYLQGGVA